MAQTHRCPATGSFDNGGSDIAVSHSSKRRPVFVVGTGRSGTHWLAYILQRHPEIRMTIEKEPMFGWSTRIALNPELSDRLLWKLILFYRIQFWISAPRHYLDKSHPNIWIAEDLARAFPDALFLGILRDPYGTVASMLRHKG